MTNKERFIELLRSTKREGIEKLIDFLEKTDFFTAPASTRFHMSCEGGLLQHSLNVYDCLVNLGNHDRRRSGIPGCRYEIRLHPAGIRHHRGAAP